ncbi:MAG: 23S rRNA (adenine(2503)-C(2))-methyltransferase RlmN [Paludibacteraceae bacterium]|nr:23S rRNA (adenine(2503)-C(2))-methyltransferase RlmN [Paludibacteraceae bacterium]
MEYLLGKTLNELTAIAEEAGLKRFAGKQIADWLYQKRVTTIDQMTNLSLAARDRLKQRYSVGRQAPRAHAESIDGTKKYLFSVTPVTPSERGMGGVIESVYIPEDDRATLCVSTQAGCKMACRFCMTGTLGFHGSLTATDILNQVFSIPESETLTNLVYMGEGEPMDNLDAVLRSIEVLTAPWGCAWSPKRITVSSVGLVPELKRFLDSCECHLAISLHNPFAIERRQIMPIEQRYPLSEVIALLKQYDFSHQRRVSFEYICWGGVNDTPKHANELLRLLRGLECRVNLIRFHEGVERDFPASDEKQMVWMRDYLTEKGLTTTIRRSRGEDILAACGMLVNQLNESGQQL